MAEAYHSTLSGLMAHLYGHKAEPRGSAELLERAVQILQPHGPAGGLGMAMVAVAWQFNNTAAAEVAAPKPSAAAKPYQVASNALRKAAAALKDRNFLATSVLNDGISDSEILLIEQIATKVEAARHRAASITRPGTLFGKAHPGPKTSLAMSCAELALKTRPEIITQQPTGSFYELVALVYEFATGHSADSEGAGLEGHVAKAGKKYGKIRRLIGEGVPVSVARDRVLKSGLPAFAQLVLSDLVPAAPSPSAQAYKDTPDK